MKQNDIIKKKIKAKELFGNYYFGKDELYPFITKLGLDCSNIEETEIHFSEEDLKWAASNGYILIYGIKQLNNIVIDIIFLRKIFGIKPDESEPCFYDQDWYIKENFVRVSLSNRWYLIKKNIIEGTRAVVPIDLESKGIKFPKAILCAYTFFANYIVNNEYLWYHDFIWCSDKDHNGDRIYLGKYNDIDGVNKNGFSIHRHLSLRQCYGSIDSF